MNWVSYLRSPAGARRELKLFAEFREDPGFDNLMHVLVEGTLDILRSKDALRYSCGEVFHDHDLFRVVVERFRCSGRSQYKREAQFYFVPQQPEVPSRAGAFPISCYLAFALIPSIVKVQGEYSRQDMLRDFPCDLISRDCVHTVFSIHERLAETEVLGLTAVGGKLRLSAPKKPPVPVRTPEDPLLLSIRALELKLAAAETSIKNCQAKIAESETQFAEYKRSVDEKLSVLASHTDKLHYLEVESRINSRDISYIQDWRRNFRF